MILSNVAIIDALDSGRLVIDPRPSAPAIGQPSQFNTTAIDLTLGNALLVLKAGLAAIIDPR